MPAAPPAESLGERWREGAHCWRLRVYYEDTDFSGLVYHAAYLRFAERGRSEFLRSCGIAHRHLLSRTPPLAFVVTAMRMRFLAPARMDEQLEVHTLLRALGPVRLRLEQAIACSGSLLWQGTCAVACIVPQYGADAKGRARLARVPAFVRERLAPHLCSAPSGAESA